MNQNIERYLLAAIEGFQKFKDYQNLISCYLKLGEYKLAVKAYTEAKTYAEEADALSKNHNEQYFRAD